jgi:hypothetical protein
MTLIEAMRTRRSSMTRQDVTVLRGLARLLLADGRSTDVDGQLSMSRTFFSLSGCGSFTCDKDIAFDAVNSSSWLKLVFDEGPAVEINIYKLRSGDSQAQCWFEVQG